MKVIHTAWMGFVAIISGAAVAGDIIPLDSCCHIGGVSGGQTVNLYWDVPVVITPTKINLKCDVSGSGSATDSGVIAAEFNNDPTQGFYTENIDNLDPTSAPGFNGTPMDSVRLVPFVAGGLNDPRDGTYEYVPIQKATFSYDTNNKIIGVKVFYLTCMASSHGLAQLINALGLNDNDTVDLAVVGTVTTTTSGPSTPLLSLDYDHATNQ
jgi:hypothetical protein